MPRIDRAYSEEVGKRLRTAREQMGWDRTTATMELRKYGVPKMSAHTLDSHESGDTSPLAQYIRAYCIAYGVCADQILGLRQGGE